MLDVLGATLICQSMPSKLPNLSRTRSSTRWLMGHGFCSDSSWLSSVKDVMEVPDADATRMIRSIKESGWRVSGKLEKEYFRLQDATLALRVVKAVQSPFGNRDTLPIIG